MKYNLTVLAVFFVSLSVLASNSIEFPGDQNCVAWKTKKTMMMFKKAEPVGYNCKINIETEEVDKNTSIKVTIPIGEFDSGEAARDSEVKKILGAEKFPNILFEVVVQNHEEIEKSRRLPGRLTFNGISHDLVFNLTISGNKPNREIRGQIQTKFSDLGLKPPRVAYGVVANVQDYLELHFRISESKLSTMSKSMPAGRNGLGVESIYELIFSATFNADQDA